MKITSTESLDAHVAEIVRLKLRHAADTARHEMEIAALQKKVAAPLADLCDRIAEAEADAQVYCEAHRAELFPDKKSRETVSAVIGFEFTPPRVETSSKKIRWEDVVTRLLRLPWGKAYVRTPAPKPDKEALLTDREKLSAEQQTFAGIQFRQDEQFYIRPKSDVAEATTIVTA
jgi:phage host-nuclease inhibitor protein Gam